MYKKITLSLALALSVSAFVGCSHKTVTHTQYTAYGRYYADGTIVTDNGNEWGYSTDTVSGKTPYDNMPVWVAFDDNGTPAEIKDDIILGIVYDRNTAIYDALEEALTDSFSLEREGNNITIKGIH